MSFVKLTNSEIAFWERLIVAACEGRRYHSDTACAKQAVEFADHIILERRKRIPDQTPREPYRLKGVG